MKIETAPKGTNAKTQRAESADRCFGLRREVKRHAAFGSHACVRKAVSPLRSATAVQSLASLLLLTRHSVATAVCVLVLIPSAVFAATNDLSGLLQQGLFEEEANRNLDAAAQAYQSVSRQFDQDRALAATAIFRLGEIYRKQNKTNEAAAQYERIVRDFAEQTTLVTLSRQNLAGLGFSSKSTNRSASSSVASRAFEYKIKVGDTLSRIVASFQSTGMEVTTEDVLRANPGLNSTSLRVGQTILIPAPEGNGTSGIIASGLVGGMGSSDLAKLKKLSRAELLQVLPTLVPDPLLAKLLEQQNTAAVKQAELSQDLGPNSPEIQKLIVVRELLDKQINERTAGIIMALELRGGTEAAGAVANRSTKPDVDLNGFFSSEDDEIRRLQTLIQNSPDLINGPAEGESPLYTAAGAGRLRVAMFLLDNGANVNKLSAGRTPLHNAVQFGHKAMVELLLQRGANVDAKDGTGGTALHLAAQSGFLSIAEVLLKNKADLNARNSKSNGEQTPLHLAVGGGHRVMSEFLVDHGADVNAPDASGQTPSFVAVARGHSELLARLLVLGAKPDVLDNQGRTALSYAAAGHLESVKVLLAAKADPNAGRSDLPLPRAIHSRSPAIAELLLRADADPNRIAAVSSRLNPRTGRQLPSYLGNPLDAAIDEGDAGLVKLLLQFKADPNGSTSKMPFVVRVARSPALLQPLLDAGADPNAAQPESEGGATALHLAAGAPNRESAKLLLEHGANPNVRAVFGQHGVTPLMLAANQKDAGLVELLLEHKADPNLVDARGNTALLNAVKQQSPEVVRALLAGGANPDTENSVGYPVLMIAVTDAANKEVVKVLIEGKANVNAPDPDGKTPLHWAAERKRTDLVELLVNAGADVNRRDKSGKTALDYAKQGAMPGGSFNPFVPTPRIPPLPGGNLQTVTSGSTPQADSAPAEVAALLRQRGALDDLPDFTRIRITRQGIAQPFVVFSKGAKLTNQFTLLEAVMNFYSQPSVFSAGRPSSGGIVPMGPASQVLAFPDFGRLIIHRPDPTKVGKEQEIKVSLLNASNVVDCAKDVPVQFGDVIEIPERVHALNETPDNPARELERVLTEANRSTDAVLMRLMQRREDEAVREGAARAADAQRLACLQKSVQLVVAGETKPLRIITWQDGFLGAALARTEARAVLRSSSDLSRVKVTRKDARTGRTVVLTVDVSENPQRNEDLWLQDGDVIEVPDKL